MRLPAKNLWLEGTGSDHLQAEGCRRTGARAYMGSVPSRLEVGSRAEAAARGTCPMPSQSQYSLPAEAHSIHGSSSGSDGHQPKLRAQADIITPSPTHTSNSRIPTQIPANVLSELKPPSYRASLATWIVRASPITSTTQVLRH